MENKRAENKSIIKKIVVSTIIVASTISLFGIANMFFSEEQYYSYDNITSHSIVLENAEVELNVLVGNINSTNIEVQTTGLGVRPSLSLKERDGVLHILQPTRSNFIPNIGGSTKLVVDITVDRENALNQFELNTESGRIKVNGMDAEVINISSQSGEVYLEDIVSDTLIVSTQSGEIYLGDLVSDTLIVSTQSGEVRLENIEINYLETASESGKCTVNFSEDLAQLNSLSKSSSGDITYIFHNDIPLNLSWAARNVISDIESSKESENKLHFESESGTIRIVS